MGFRVALWGTGSVEAALEPPLSGCPTRPCCQGSSRQQAETLPCKTPSRPSTGSVKGRAGQGGRRLMLSVYRNLGAHRAGQGGYVTCEGQRGEWRRQSLGSGGEGKGRGFREGSRQAPGAACLPRGCGPPFPSGHEGRRPVSLTWEAARGPPGKEAHANVSSVCSPKGQPASAHTGGREPPAPRGSPAGRRRLRDPGVGAAGGALARAGPRWEPLSAQACLWGVGSVGLATQPHWGPRQVWLGGG